MTPDVSTVGDLVALYGYYSKFLAAGALPLPDGSGPTRRPGFEDSRDPDKLAHAGLLASYLHRMIADRQGGAGALYEAVLRAYFSRAGQTNQGARLVQAVTELEHRQVVPLRRCGKQRRLELYENLLNEAIAAFGDARRRVNAARQGGDSES